MVTHQEQALQYLSAASDVQVAEKIGGNTQVLASVATAHAVLALIDIIQGDRETEIEQLHNRIEDLESMLSGCREALRQRDLAETNAANTTNKEPA